MELDPLSRTALIPFWARAQDAVSARPVLGDTAAAQLAARVRQRFGEQVVDRSTRVGCCLRNLLVDRWIADLVDADTVIVEIGVGLNTRADRLPVAARQYVEVDGAQIIELRDDLLPARGVVRLASDGMDVKRWAHALDATRPDRVIITLEGVLAYQPADVVTRFFADAAYAFPGAYLVFDRLSASAAARANRPSARVDGRPAYRWSHGKRDGETGIGSVRVVRAQSFMDLPRSLRRHLPLQDRMMHALPPRRSAFKLLLCQLEPGEGGVLQSW
ncbi:MAG TPA: hypothetical protein VL551_34275 [Actinospica sp.]|jgi:O-methyltransferase involved in polyketide biosynthesis|nr:hypothetical protein [Actinospica sp.]